MRLLQSPVTMLFSDDNEYGGLQVSFSPPAASVLSNCSPSSISQHHHNALALRPGTDGRRSAGPTVAAGNPSVNTLTQKSNTLIRVREHLRPSSSSSSLEEASGDRYSLTQPATGKLAVATTAATGDCSKSVPSSPAQQLSSCWPF
ncbi:hypothetical protein niasHT_019015 [Heterodera trifolii]|uniref:Uncharacterized protein n=1 Tax=Heterodera trifolii TaxID=157864 RepID=A0ABD2LEG6_9BILA